MEKREYLCTVDEIANWCSYYEKQYRGSKKLKNETTLWPSNSTSGYVSEEPQNTNSKRYMLLCVHCNSQHMEATQMPINRRVDKEDVVHVYNGIKKKDFIYLFLEIEEKGGRQRGREISTYEKNINQLPLISAPTKDWACNSGMCPDQESN